MYTSETPILGEGTATAPQIEAWFEKYGNAPEGIGVAITSAARHFTPYVVNHDLVAGMIAHETGYWTSYLALVYNNPSGLGAENDDPVAKAVKFPHFKDGIIATVAHLLTYAVGDGWWRTFDPRYTNVARKNWLGVAPTLAGLDGRWAWPGNGYGASVARRANVLTGELLEDIVLTIRDGIIPKTNRNRPGVFMIPKKITIHNTGNSNVGADAEMHRQFVLNGGGAEGVSFHYVVDDSEIIQLLPDNETGIHAGSLTGNRTSIAIEGCVNQDGNFSRMLENDAWLTATLLRRHGLAVIGDVVQHHHWSGKNCPAEIRSLGWNVFLGMVQASYDSGAPVDTSYGQEFVVPGIGTFFVGGGFWEFYQKFGGMEVDGLPLSNEYNEPRLDGMLIQWFERSRYEHQPGKWPERYDVFRGRLGAELQAAWDEIDLLRAEIERLKAGG